MSLFNYTNALYNYDVKAVYYGGLESDWSNKIAYIYGTPATFLEDDDEPVVGVPGDVNGDGQVTAGDITCLYNYLLNNDQTYVATSDVNGDGEITAGDITFIYNILLGNNN